MAGAMYGTCADVQLRMTMESCYIGFYYPDVAFMMV